jgi:hypothetical protein
VGMFFFLCFFFNSIPHYWWKEESGVLHFCLILNVLQQELKALNHTFLIELIGVLFSG